MNAAIIGLTASLVTIVLFILLKRLDKSIIYGLVLSGIGFLYVGYTWSNPQELVMNIIQAIVFIAFAYLGITKSLYFMIAGYLLHGVWDIVYHLFANPSLLPPHYDYFCMTYDFVVGFYLLFVKLRMDKDQQVLS